MNLQSLRGARAPVIVALAFALLWPGLSWSGVPATALAQSPGSPTSAVARPLDPSANAMCYSARFHRGNLIIDWIDPIMRAASKYLSEDQIEAFVTVTRVIPRLVARLHLPEPRTIDAPIPPQNLVVARHPSAPV